MGIAGQAKKNTQHRAHKAVMRVGSFMVTKDKLVVAAPTTSIADAARQMVEKHVSATVIVDGDSPVGIITKTDVIRALIVDSLDSAEPVSKIMATSLVTINADMARDEAAEE